MNVVYSVVQCTLSCNAIIKVIKSFKMISYRNYAFTEHLSYCFFYFSGWSYLWQRFGCLGSTLAIMKKAAKSLPVSFQSYQYSSVVKFDESLIYQLIAIFEVSSGVALEIYNSSFIDNCCCTNIVNAKVS